MIFGLDLDGTYAADAVAFHKIVDVLLERGHACVLVTNRCDDDRDVDAIRELVHRKVPILYSCGKPKREVARAAGYVVSIWIDDNPILVDLGEAGLKMVGVFRNGELI